jgi:signal transduction histidine kinase/DNA-binding response OmpR family regulator
MNNKALTLKIATLEQQLKQVETERDNLSHSLELMSAHFEEITRTQTMALEQARDLALSASRSKSEFLANMSHEIRTPLTAIIGFSSSLADESLSESDVNLATASIVRNSHHLMSIINDILDLAKIEQQHFELEQIQFNLFEVLHEVEESISVQAIEKNLWLKVHYQYPLPALITTDPTWVKQVLLNLASNALKFTQQGRIDISVSYLADENKIAISVSDTGIGIAKAQQTKIFEPFSQADTTTTRRYGGTGLGLTICNKLAQLMNGKITVTSEPGQGCKFVFEFAIATVASNGLIYKAGKETTIKNSSDEPTYKIPSLRGKVLVAEDSIDTQNLVALYIKKAGAQVEFANNGQIAVEMALAETYDLVLMDIQMPVVDGLEATGLLRQVGFSKPIIAFTANAEKYQLEQAIKAGCNGHITKPIDKAAFFKVLGQYLQKSDDPVNIQSFTNFLDDDEFNTIRANFIRRTPQFITELNQAINNNNVEHAKVLLHTLKGTFGSLGFKLLYSLTHQLAQQLKRNIYPTSVTPLSINSLQKELNNTMIEMKIDINSPLDTGEQHQ